MATKQLISLIYLKNSDVYIFIDLNDTGYFV